MPFPFSKTTTKARDDRQDASLRAKADHKHTRQYIATPQHETGRRTSDTLQREAVKLMPALKPTYRPLDAQKQEIRLIKLHPGKHCDPLVCAFESTSLVSKKHTPYETVSYCWGRNPGEAVIDLDRLPALVTRSAARVLHCMRYPDKWRVLWVDAICINQDDKDEKSHQVAMMGTIYAKTWRNLVWLGDDLGHGRAVATALDILMANLRRETANCYNLFYLTHNRTGNHDLHRNGTNLDADTRRHASKLKNLFSSPWFGRIWVAQEVALASHSLCHFGPVVFSLNDVLRAAIWLIHNTMQVPRALMNTPGLRRAMMLWYFVDREFVPPDVFVDFTGTLFSAWHFVQWMEASNAKDNVYALLGLVQNRKIRVPSLTLIPDYTKSDAEVFRDATRIMIEETGSLAIFQHRAEYGNAASLDMPSWITSFDVKMHGDSGPRPLSHSSYNAHCNWAVRASTVSSRDSLNVLSLHGIPVDRVARRTNCIPDLFRSNVGQSIHEALRVIHPANWKPGSLSADFTEKLATTLIAGYNWHGHQAGSGDVDDFMAFMKYIKRHGTNPSAAAYAEMQRHDENSQKAILCFHAIAIACSERRFFVTADGKFGLGPRGLADGDIITVLYGGALPFALRLVSKRRYRYVGACYVSGIMDGEAMRKHKADRTEDTVFHIV